MRYLSGEDEKEAKSFLDGAAEVARSATCQRHRCGSVIVSEGKTVGSGFNSPPANAEDQRRCSVQKDSYNKRVTDKTCCVHAEQRAIMDALSKNPSLIRGSRLYFIRLGPDGTATRSGKPYCTICSKMALDAGIAEFVLWHDNGVCVYNTGEYNTLSFQYDE